MYRAVEATRDIMPGEIERWQFVENVARDIFRRYGFREIRTPIFEFTELFVRSVGGETDIVSKEMYTFTDRGERSLTLRPEGTAPTVRAYVEHNLHRSQEISRLYYAGPMFRYERKQKGRYRQFHQIGAEIIGSDSPLVDAEVIEMVMHFLASVGIDEPVLLLNSIGCASCRSDYQDRLAASLQPEIDGYCKDCQRRFKENILRVLDCKVDREKVVALPSIIDHLCDACAGHFAAVKEALQRDEVLFQLEPHLVRGLDYYNRTTFEVTAGGLGAQNALLGGGRYDGLVAQLGGTDMPGFGFALGLDRLIMVLPEQMGQPAGDDIFIVAIDDQALIRARVVATRLRHAGMRVGLNPEVKSVKSQMRRADKTGAAFALIIGEAELAEDRLTLKRLSDGTETAYPGDALGKIAEDVKNARN